MADDVSQEALECFKQCSVNEFNTLCHNVAGNACSKQPLDYTAYSNVWSLEEWWRVTECIQTILKQAVKYSWSKDQVFSNLGTLSDEYKKTLMEVISVRREDLRQSLLLQTAAISQNVLTDFDWQMKLVMSSDKLSSLHTPLLNLDLQVTDCNNHNRVVSLELDRDDLKKLIGSFEGAGKCNSCHHDPPGLNPRKTRKYIPFCPSTKKDDSV